MHDSHKAILRISVLVIFSREEAVENVIIIKVVVRAPKSLSIS